MKKSSVTLTIPTPCHENWQAMTPAEQGRFCLSCQKTVLDFTTKTDREVARYFEQTASSENAGHTCGRFRPDQLQRPLHAVQPGGLGARLRAYGLVVPGLLLGGIAQAQTDRPVLMGKVACPRPTATQVEPRIVGEVVANPPKAILGDTIVVESPAPRTITGQVRDGDVNEALIGALVIISGTNIGAVTDQDGRYEITIPADMQNPALEFQYTGYASISVTVGSQAVVNAAMEIRTDLLLGEIVIVPKEQTLYSIVKHKVKNLLNKQQRKAAKQAKQPSTVEAPATLPLPILPPTENPSPTLPEAMPVEVFPNPFSHDLTIKIDCPMAGRMNIRLMDMQGQLVLTQTYEAMKGPQVLTLETSGVHLPSGQYLLELSSGGVLHYAGVVLKE